MTKPAAMLRAIAGDRSADLGSRQRRQAGGDQDGEAGGLDERRSGDGEGPSLEAGGRQAEVAGGVAKAALGGDER